MSEPRRWKDSPDAPVGMRELLGSGARSRPLDDAAFRRGARRVATISIAPAAVVAASVWTKLAAAGAIGLAAAGSIVTVAAVRDVSKSATVSSVAVPVASAAPAQRAAPAEAPPNVEPEAPAVPDPVVIRPLETAPAGPAVAPPAPVAAVEPSPAVTPWVPEEPVRPKSTLGGELDLLQSARAHLSRSPETALGELARHRALYPAGTLSAERDLMELDALRRTGRVQDAKGRAQAWLAREPHGIHAARVRQILSTIE